MFEKGIVEIFKGRMDSDMERHQAVMDIQRSLDKLHRVFLDLAVQRSLDKLHQVFLDTQGEQIDHIEKNIAIADSYVSGGTKSLLR